MNYNNSANRQRFEIDNNRITVESFYVGKNSLSDLLVEIAKRNLAAN